MRRALPSPPPANRISVMVRAIEGTGVVASAPRSAALPAPRAARTPGVAASSSGTTEVRNGTPLPFPSPVLPEKLVSEKALEQVPAIAPGWDKYALVERYKAWVAGKGEMPRFPDAAFLGWVRKFTKGKRP